MAANNKVLMIYTGGTIGMLPAEENNPISPLVPANWEKLKKYAPSLKELSLEVELEEMKLIDSSDMHPDYWIDIARKIRDNYSEYSGFVVLHGTDTMTYTATALSFLLENLDKPIIITGSQLPLGRPRSDALQNLVTSVMLAAPHKFDLPLIPEVCIFFHDLLLRGNRSRKVSSSAYSGFFSPNFQPLGRIGEHFDINKRLIRKPSQEGFFINEQLEKNVLIFDVFPGIKPEILKSLFEIKDLKGVVLRTFGAGNTPTNEEFLREIEYGINKKNLAIVNITQCVEGTVEMGLYDASAQLQQLGVISGVDMTPEAALVKMQFLLGLGYELKTVKEMMQKNLRGEQSLNVDNFMYERGAADLTYKGPAMQLPAGFNKDKIAAANIRIDGAAFGKDIPDGEIKLAVFMNYPSAEATVDQSDDDVLAIPQCLGIMKKAFNGKPVNMILDCTERLGRVLVPGRPAQIAFVSKSKQKVMWNSASVSVYTEAE